MAGRLFIFGLGNAGKRIATRLRERGWQVDATGSDGNIAFDDDAAVRATLAGASHVLSSIPPAESADPVLANYGDALDGKWLGYLSSTGVYGDRGGAWVDEATPLRGARRQARLTADLAWLAREARVFRLAGIYGPGRSPIDRVRGGKAHRIDLPGQVFSRIHVDDIESAAVAGFDAPPGAYNICDDEPAEQRAVTEEAARLAGVEPPPLQTIEEAGLSEMARSFYAQNRRVSNRKAKRELGWEPLYPTYREGLRSLV